MDEKTCTLENWQSAVADGSTKLSYPAWLRTTKKAKVEDLVGMFIRFPSKLRDLLQDAALEGDRSINAEIVRRIRQSFMPEKSL